MQTSFPRAAGSAAAPLKLWQPAETPAEPQEQQETREERARRRRDERRQWTLRELYRRHVWPKVLKPRVLRGRLDATTVGKPSQDGEGGHIGAALARWEELMPDPSLDQVAIGAEEPAEGFVDATEFPALLATAEWRGKPLAGATIERHTKYVQQILDCSGPDRRRGRELIRGARALSRREIPCVLYRHEQRAALPPYSLEQLWTWIQLVRVDPGNHGRRPWTEPIEPAAWHEACLLFLHNTGARPGMTLFISREMLRGENWLCVPARYVKGKRRDLEIYLNPPLRAALERIDYRAPRERIFPWRGWPDSKPRLCEVVRDQLRRAGLPPYGYYGIRRLFSTIVLRRHPLVSSWMMGHSPPKELRMQAAHYAWKEEVIRVMDHYPQPGRLVQKTLFDLAE